MARNSLNGDKSNPNKIDILLTLKYTKSKTEQNAIIL